MTIANETNFDPTEKHIWRLRHSPIQEDLYIGKTGEWQGTNVYSLTIDANLASELSYQVIDSYGFDVDQFEIVESLDYEYIVGYSKNGFQVFVENNDAQNDFIQLTNTVYEAKLFLQSDVDQAFDIAITNQLKLYRIPAHHSQTSLDATLINFIEHPQILQDAEVVIPPMH